ncbi:MAG: hypothetical protein ACI9MS_003552 [Glaciecola sp.]|jgi:hypothetical protein
MLSYTPPRVLFENVADCTLIFETSLRTNSSILANVQVK